MKRVAFFVVAFLLLVSVDDAAVYHVDPDNGSDQGQGTVETPFKTVDHALRLVNGKGGEIHLTPNSLLTKSIPLIRKSGLPDQPIIIDGHGSTINLGKDITEGPWTKIDDGYRYENDVPKHRTVYGTSPVFVNGLPLYCKHASGRGVKPWHDGFIRYDEQGKLVVVFPKGLDLKNSVIVLTGENDGCSGLLVNGSSHVIVRNITAVFAGNDGFNFHGTGENILLDNVTALFNGDEGISSHETYFVDVVNSEVAFSGSADGGIVDINDCTTTYKNMRVHQNRAAAFKLIGKQHKVENFVSYGNPGGNIPQSSNSVVVVDGKDGGKVEEDATVPVFAGQTVPTNVAEIKESDRMLRFLQYRPR